MSNYKIDTIAEIDIDKILDIYNSNTHFLENHMGITEVSREFITNEIKEMKNIGFNSLVIKDCMSNIIGICDFKISEEVYLSLLMIDANQQGKGLGSIVYNQLEKLFKENHANKVRIDVGDMKVGDVIKVKDLAIAQDKDVDLKTDLEAAVVSVAAVHVDPTVEAEEEAAEEEAK